MNYRKNALLGLASAAVFALLYLMGILTQLEDMLYDFFLHFRPNRPHIDNVVFLDIDDNAIAHNGIFPWPRSITADGLLRLKEYGAQTVILDIDYTDRGQQGMDSQYLEHGLGDDINLSFSEINSAAQNIFSAISAGQAGRANINLYAEHFSALLDNEKQNFFFRMQNAARDNDHYTAQVMALCANVWPALSLCEFPLSGEQAERKTLVEERFSYPINAAGDAEKGMGFLDVLPPLPVFSRASKGAGFTNIEGDDDGVIRRIYLTRNINDHWYLQLAFAPLVEYLGKPEITLERHKLTLHEAHLPDGEIKDIIIPLDNKGRMMLDWPKENYERSYSHVSFADFSLLDEIEMDIEKSIRALSAEDVSSIPFKTFLNDTVKGFDAARVTKNNALKNLSNTAFDSYLKYRNNNYTRLEKISTWDMDTALQEQLRKTIIANLDRWKELTRKNNNAVRDKLCIIGRADTGTTGFGVNPFYRKYVNIGAHAVVLDSILSETFITPIRLWIQILFMLLFVSLFFLFSAKLPPLIRAITSLAITVIYLVVTAVVFRVTGIFLGPMGIVFSMISAAIVREIILYSKSEKEKKFIHTAFSTYVSGDIVKDIISDPTRLQLGGSVRHMTALFTDVRNFTSIAEKLGPEALVDLLNRYLSAMSNIIIGAKGTIDKYQGDAIIAFFGAPQNLKDHALRACVSAINMKKIETGLNKIIVKNRMAPDPLLTRIGINTGDMVAGNMGTENKMNYTIMGNAVNLAARLEGINKYYGTWILATESTVKETGKNLFTRKLDRIRVAGIREPVRIYELLDTAGHANAAQRKMVKVFQEALDYFEQRKWRLAAKGFKEAVALKADDYPSNMYLERSKHFIDSPPKDRWDGIYSFKSK